MVKKGRKSELDTQDSHFTLFLKSYMHAIMTYVKQNKWKVFATVFLFGALFFAFNTFKPEDQESPELRQRKLLSTVGHLLESDIIVQEELMMIFLQRFLMLILKHWIQKKILFYNQT